jgi:hypothetical protein
MLPALAELFYGSANVGPIPAARLPNGFMSECSASVEGSSCTLSLSLPGYNKSDIKAVYNREQHRVLVSCKGQVILDMVNQRAVDLEAADICVRRGLLTMSFNFENEYEYDIS